MFLISSDARESSKSVLNFAMLGPAGLAHQPFSSSMHHHAYLQRRPLGGCGMAQPRAVICGVARTPIGKFLGSLSHFSAVDLGVLTVKELCQRVGLDPNSGMVDEVLFGQVLQAGAGQNPARQVALGAGLPVSTPCTTINKVCGSSLKAAMMAANSIRAGEYKVIIAGGMESMSNAPQLLMGHRSGCLLYTSPSPRDS